MCGIFFTSIPYLSQQQSYEAFTRIRHRGPDQSVYVSIGDQTYGFHHLAITTHLTSTQPFRTHSCRVLCNGEIYNWKQLAQQYDLPVESDCEVIAHLYSLLGFEHMIQSLDGEFALIIHDTYTQKVYAARDFMGIRPLYMYHGKDGFALASEIKSISGHGRVQHIIPRTFYTFDIDRNTVDTQIYWHFPNAGREIFYRPTKLLARLYTLLHDSVRDRLYSKRPIGCLLSGGIDSSLIAALASKHIPNLQCFTIGAETSPDVKAARQVAEFLKVPLTVVDFSEDEGLASIIPVIYHLETFDITTIRASIPQFLLAKWIRTHTDVRVILSGEGSDELFSGYVYSKRAPNAKALYEDGVRLLDELYQYDCLRTDRVMAAWGLEVRVPFLQRQLVQFVLSLDPEYRLCKETTFNGIDRYMEKMLLRSMIQYQRLLPETITFRPKEAFSDAVSSDRELWYQTIQKWIEPFESFESFVCEPINRMTGLQPISKESHYYRKVFDCLYPGQSHILKQYWMPRWSECSDPSATVLECYRSSRFKSLK
jgi:asparagine synthase (glutamine-hydrolysing)